MVKFGGFAFLLDIKMQHAIWDMVEYVSDRGKIRQIKYQKLPFFFCYRISADCHLAFISS